MKIQMTKKWHESFQCRLFLMVVIATLSVTTLVRAQTATARGGEKDAKPAAVAALMTTVKDQQQQIRRQQQEIESLKKPGNLGAPGDGDSGPGTIVGSGTPIKHIISMTQSLVFSSPNSASIEISVPGAQPTDLVMIGLPAYTSHSYILRRCAKG